MTNDPYANDDDGSPLYVVTRREWGRSYDRLVKAPTLKEAKRDYGYTRELHVSVRVRRARCSDVARITAYEEAPDA